MLDLSELISAINVSVQRASDALSRSAIESFERYFISTKEATDAKVLIRDALERASAQSEHESPAEVFRQLAHSLEAASTALEPGTAGLQPKVVTIDYPMVTKNGPTVHTVHVPLIALSPFTGIQVTRLTFNADLDVHEGDDGTVKVSFASSGKGPPPAEPGSPEREPGDADAPLRRSNTSIQVIVESVPAPDGLRKVIEGYERALRAQIPG
jgi:hypothetical protein